MAFSNSIQKKRYDAYQRRSSSIKKFTGKIFAGARVLSGRASLSLCKRWRAARRA
jgi:hypothetical protein